MVRVYLKGGIWTNAEDEVLKAAIQKYGKQQWARVASLLNKKTAKQAKARWHEWLDPSIRKTEWSRAEEEKLLHLAKLMPAQWRTIAPLVGRTATQCQEHYESLLDQAAGGAADDKLRQQQQQLRPGQIDAHPETKPARPDPIDMDDDEMEMLQEARARLANTVGKKAKRKMRERMLANAKRLADLQKRRELKQAGLLSDQVKKKKNRREIDLGAEIPFYKPAPAGFHDTAQEQTRTQRKLDKHLRNVDLKRVNESVYRTRDREAALAKKKQEERMKVLEKTNQQYAAAKKEQEEAVASHRPRGNLKLPPPSVKNEEWSQMAKLQLQQQQGQDLGGGSATQALLGDYSDRPLPTPMRTPMTGAASVKTNATGMSLMEQASQLRRLEQGQTPLLVRGGEDQEEEDQDDSDRKVSAATPMPPDRAGAGRTPSRRRDALGLNSGQDVDDSASLGASTFATRQSSIREMARQEKRAIKKARLELEKALAALPVPQFEYELAAPDSVPEDDDMAGPKVETVRDQAEIEAREREEMKKKAEKLYAAQSSVLKRSDLPRPTNIPTSLEEFGEDAIGWIQKEALLLMQHDAYNKPVQEKGKKKKRKHDELMEEVATTPQPPSVSLDVLAEEAVAEAKNLVEKETEIVMEEKIVLAIRDGKAATREEAMSFLTNETVGAALAGKRAYFVLREGEGWVEARSNEDVRECLRQEFVALREATDGLRKKNDKLESKLGVLQGGYAKKAESTKEEVSQLHGLYQNGLIEEVVYSMLEKQEQRGGQNRMERLEKELRALRENEARLQKRFGELLVEKRRAAVVSRVEAN